MAGHLNRIEQLEGLRNITTNADFYEQLASGKITSIDSHGGAQPYYIPVPITIKAQLGSPTALAIGAFATTLTSLSFALMGWRGLSVTNAFVGDFFAVAGIGMVVSAQWEIVLGNTYAYTVLSAFGLFYFGFGVIITPTFGVADAYGGADSVQYNNALGFFVLSKNNPNSSLASPSMKTHTHVPPKPNRGQKNSVVRFQHLLPHRLPPAQSNLHRHLPHGPAGLYARLGVLLHHGRRQRRARQQRQSHRRRLRLCVRHAGLVHGRQPHVPGGHGLQLPHGRHEPLLPPQPRASRACRHQGECIG